ncbi:MAG: glutamate 5-kinase [Bacteroidota bacterium]
MRVVVKLGTSVLTGGTRPDGSARLDRAHLVDLVRQCARLHADGHDMLIVSSGAVAAGREELGLSEDEHPGGVVEKQLLAAVGQPRLMRVWAELFDLFGLHVGQVLLARDDVEDRRRFLNARDTLDALLERCIVPVINENDAVATAEIKVGDNDNLSAYAAILARADLLLLLTDQLGLFTADPRVDPDAELIPEVRTIDATLQKLAGGAGTAQGTGGMATKLQAADAARRAGTDVVIAAGRAPDVILRIAQGEAVGTRFPALETPLASRKRWIFAGPTPAGTLVVNDGAARALAADGASLLPVGIVAVEGTFRRGDPVRIVRHNTATDLGRGIARYDADELRRLAGLRSVAIAATLGFTLGDEAIHRDDLILV